MNSRLVSTATVILALSALCPLALHAQISPLTAPTLPVIPEAPAVTLRYKFVVGQVYRYQYNMDLYMLINAGQTGTSVPLTMTIQMTMRQMVKSIQPADGAATMVSQIETMSVRRNGQNNPLREDQQTKIRQPFTQLILPNGKILSSEAPELDIVEVTRMDFSKGMFSGTPLLPAGPVNVGGTWNDAVVAIMTGVPVAFISMLTSLDQKNGMATTQNMGLGMIDKTMTKGMPTSIKMQGPITEEFIQKFDTSAGALQSAEGVSNADITMTFGKSAEGTTPMAMPSAMKMQMKFQMLRLSDTAPAQ